MWCDLLLSEGNRDRPILGVTEWFDLATRMIIKTPSAERANLC